MCAAPGKQRDSKKISMLLRYVFPPTKPSDKINNEVQMFVMNLTLLSLKGREWRLQICRWGISYLSFFFFFFRVKCYIKHR